MERSMEFARLFPSPLVPEAIFPSLPATNSMRFRYHPHALTSSACMSFHNYRLYDAGAGAAKECSDRKSFLVGRSGPFAPLTSYRHRVSDFGPITALLVCTSGHLEILEAAGVGDVHDRYSPVDWSRADFTMRSRSHDSELERCVCKNHS